MKQIVCREDIQAELDILCKLHTDVDILKSQVETLKDRVEFLETKNMRDVSISTPITSTRI
jgi:cell division protein FtsB